MTRSLMVDSEGPFVVINVFVIGLDDLNEAVLHRLPGASQYNFHQLLGLEALCGRWT